MEIIRLLKRPDLNISDAPGRFDVPTSTYYRWKRKYRTMGINGLQDNKPLALRARNRLPPGQNDNILEYATLYPEYSSSATSLYITDNQGFSVSESSDEFHTRTTKVNELGQTDATYLKVERWGWYYLITLLDDYRRRILSWKLLMKMVAGSFSEVVEPVSKTTGIENVPVENRVKRLSDNGSTRVAKELGDYLEDSAIGHI